MQALTLEDLMPLEEFIARRRELFEQQSRYIDRYRRARIGPSATLLFENRQTLWFRAQDVLRIARIADPVQVQRELDIYNRLLPGSHCLQAAFLIEIQDEARMVEELQPWQEFHGDQLKLLIGEQSFPAQLITSRPEDRCLGASHWVQFHLGPNGTALLADTKLPAHLHLELTSFSHQARLSEEVRQSLLEDLQPAKQAG